MRHKNQILASIFAISSLLHALSAPGEERQAKHDPALQQIESALKELFLKEKIAPTFSWEGDKLIVEHETHKFMVHGPLMNGEFAEQATEEIGPRSRGFLMEIELRHGNPAELQAVVPQTIHGPYWQTYIDTPGVRPSSRVGKTKLDHYYFLRLSYGGWLNEKLRNEIQRIVEDTISAHAK